MLGSRIRKRDEQRPTQYHVVVKVFSTGVVASDYNLATGVEGIVSTIEDYNHPGYRKNKGKQTIMGSMALARSWRTTDGSTSYHIRHPGFGDVLMEGDVMCIREGNAASAAVGIGLNGINVGSYTLPVLLKAYAKINTMAVMSGEIMHDMDKTLEGFHRPFGKSRDLLQRMLRSRARNLGKTVASAAKATANAWLEYRYGWKPLILDMNSLVEKAHILRGQSEMYRSVARAGARDQRIADASYDQTFADGIQSVGTVHGERKLRVDAGVIFDVKHQTSSDSLYQLLGVRPKDLVQTVWEIIPYSFVADWFVGVGDWLQAVTPDPAVSIHGNWVTSVEQQRIIYHPCTLHFYVSASPATSFDGICTGSEVGYDSVLRTVNIPLPTYPVFQAKTLGTLHSIDALALSCNSILNTLSGMRH